MAGRRDVLGALGLSPPLLALITGELSHPVIEQKYRFFPDDRVRPTLAPPEGLVPLWEDVQGPPHFFMTVFAKPGPDGPEFWSIIFDEGDPELGTGSLLTRTEQGLLFWVFHELLQREPGTPGAANWDLPALADRLGFRYLPELMDYRRACSAGIDDDDRIEDLVRTFPVGLPPVADRPERLFERGEGFFSGGEYAEALTDFRAAWSALPEPKNEHTLGAQIQAAISDCEFHLGDWVRCHRAMQHALRCGLPLDNVFARLRLGQSLYELGNESEAANWLVPVYLLHGRGPFEADDPKYLEFFRPKLRPPEGGWPEGW
jgi:hypothetical protein